ncbi:MAG: hypothetical protein VX003_17400, partial [SAR324 cluster bacterium]|nr:hypothetical protein [SAR324 cluster bacterium]
MGDWGTGDFEVSLSIKAKSGTKISGESNRDYAALFVKSTQASSPYTGPMAFVWDDGKVEFRLRGDESMYLPGVVSSWANWVDLRFKYTSALKKIQIYVNGEEKGSKILSKTISATHFLNAPLRFGGNHLVPLDQNLNAEIKNLYISGINEPIGRDWRAVARVSDNSVNGVVNFNVSYKDLAGNIGDNRTQANSNTKSITVDTQAPVLTSLSMSTDNADTYRAKTGNRLTLSFSANEDLDPNSLELKLNGVDKKLSRSGSEWEHSHTFTDSDPEGPINMVLNYKDLAGNSGTEKKSPHDVRTIDFDRKAPTFTVGYSRDGPYNNDDTFDINV